MKDHIISNLANWYDTITNYLVGVSVIVGSCRKTTYAATFKHSHS